MTRSRYPYLFISVAAGVLVVWGFWRTYFSTLLTGSSTHPWLIHVHAAVFMGWLLLVIAQAALVSMGRSWAHRALGRLGFCYGALVLCVGVAVSVAAPSMRLRSGQLELERASLVVAFNLTDMAIFAGFFVMAIVYRRHSAVHQRLVLSATVALMGAAVGRVLPGGSFAYFAVWLSPLFASMLLELVEARRLHPVSVASFFIFVAAFYKVPLLSSNPVPMYVGRALLQLFGRGGT